MKSPGVFCGLSSGGSDSSRRHLPAGAADACAAAHRATLLPGAATVGVDFVASPARFLRPQRGTALAMRRHRPASPRRSPTPGCQRTVPANLASPRRQRAANLWLSSPPPAVQTNRLQPAIAVRRHGWPAQSRDPRSTFARVSRHSALACLRWIAPLFGLGHRPQTRILQYPPDCVRRDQRLPVVRFRHLLGDAPLAPCRMLASQRPHLRFDLAGRSPRLLGRMASLFGQRRISARLEACFPVVEGAPTHMRLRTRLLNVSRLFPALEEQPSLSHCRRSIVRSFCLHTDPSYRYFPHSKSALSR